MKQVVDAAYRWSVVSRIVAAALGGYLIVTLLHVAFIVVLPSELHQSLLFASQTGYLWWTGLIIWCFAVRSATRAWAGLAVLAAPLIAIDTWYLLTRSVA